MSTWTNERHEEARKALEEDMSQWGTEYGDAVLDEIERLRALTTITDSMVERAARAMAGLEHGDEWPSDVEMRLVCPHISADEYREMRREEARFFLEAALNPPT